MHLFTTMLLTVVTVNADATSLSAQDVFKKSAQAITRARFLRYVAQYEGTDWVAQFVPAMKGMVTMGKQSEYEVDTFKCKVEVKRHDEEEATLIEAGCDGDQYYLVDAKTKTVYRDMDPEVLGKYGRDVPRVVLREFSKSMPFDDKHEGKTIELVGERTIIDEPCYEIHIKGGDSPDIAWFISTRDFIPRRYVRIHKNQHDEPGSTQLTLSAVEIDPEISRSVFVPKTPEGYRVTDEFPE